MTIFPQTIRRAQFPQAWEFVARKNRRARVCAMIRKTTAVLSSVLLMLLVLFLGGGLLLQLEGSPVADWIREVPWLYSLCLEAALWLVGSGLPVVGQGLFALVLVFFLCFAVCALVAGFICLCYRPELQLPPEGTAFEKAQALRDLGEQTIRLTRHKMAGTVMAATAVFVLVSGGLAALFCLRTGIRPEGMTLALGALAVLLGYGILTYGLQKLLGLLYYCKLPPAMMYTLEVYCEQCRPEEKAAKKEKP